jgi:hypothetical protein
MRPVSKLDGILSSDVGDEVVLFDSGQNRYYVLSAVSGFVWRSADGERSREELAEMVAARFSVPESRELVELALQELTEAQLLRMSQPDAAADAAAQVPTQARLDRRAALQRLSAAGVTALLLPVVTGMHAPTTWSAASCDATGNGRGVGHELDKGEGHYTDPPGRRLGHCKYDDDPETDWPPVEPTPGNGGGKWDEEDDWGGKGGGKGDDWLDDLFDWFEKGHKK